MRAIVPFRLLVPAAALLAAGCDDSSSPLSPDDTPVAEAEAPAPVVEGTSGPLEDLAYWADGYLLAAAIDGKFTHAANASWNRSGSPIVVTKVAGTTGRYIARFRNLSGLLGGKSTVHVTAFGDHQSVHYCKPVGGFLVRDSVEVRCFQVGTGAPVNGNISVNVLGKRDDRAFAFASQPTATNYAPASAGSWNPAGATRVYRDGVGAYRVVFSGMGARLPAGAGGNVQVNAVGTNKVHCMVDEWGGSPDLIVAVACFAPSGARADSKFSTLFTPPAAHLAYVWADQPMTASYQPHAMYASNPVGGAVTVSRSSVGTYEIRWTGIDAEIREYGNAQVTSWGFDNAQCKVTWFSEEAIGVKCYGPKGAPMDTYFSALLGS